MDAWPPLGPEDAPTIAALHLFSQIPGKVALATLPWRNHGWHLTYRLCPRGFRTQPLRTATGAFEFEFDLVDHHLRLIDGNRADGSIPLRPMPVSVFYNDVMTLLGYAGHKVHIVGVPNEIEPAIPFRKDDEERAYDQRSADRLRRALLKAEDVLSRFRSSFLGKVSPVQLFWGSFDLAVTRFSGREAPPHPGGIPHLPDRVTREAYSHEVSSAGFWPGGANGGTPLFYSYAYPAPSGFADAWIEPEAARYEETLGEFVLDYEAVRKAGDPESMLMDFLMSTYTAAANLGKWDRSSLECELGRPAMPRAL
ncbi:hypothetical protein IC614_10200 [Allosphingosinicella flava]|uniref:Ava_C0101 and related proteins n=1 Tax=Allosphingosinicella flava TaxID=2771430 RepID=A0A7T2GIU5_9SPHN|nr:DUF5996 family protein [Sphingosinicella flava]QPQ54689.1 hypothetical protein IC614_10200 [Sphingosinicella flava]